MVANIWRKWLTLPILQWLGRLHIVMSIDQDCGSGYATARSEPFTINNGMSSRGKYLNIVHIYRMEFVREPVRGFVHIGFVGRIMRNRSNTQKFNQFRLELIIIFFEIFQCR